MLLSNAVIEFSVTEYNFSNLIRALEKMKAEDIASLKLNNQLWILLHISHVPSRDDRKALRAWCDYRGGLDLGPYFGTGQSRDKANELYFQYDVRFLSQMRPPRPPSRYANGHQMKLDLLRTHLRMTMWLQSREKVENPSEELQRLRCDLEDLARIFNEIQGQRSDSVTSDMTAARTLSNATVMSTVSATSQLTIPEN